jgi:hypothetical protein
MWLYDTPWCHTTFRTLTNYRYSRLMFMLLGTRAWPDQYGVHILRASRRPRGSRYVVDRWCAGIGCNGNLTIPLHLRFLSARHACVDRSNRGAAKREEGIDVLWRRWQQRCQVLCIVDVQPCIDRCRCRCRCCRHHHRRNMIRAWSFVVWVLHPVLYFYDSNRYQWPPNVKWFD